MMHKTGCCQLNHLHLHTTKPVNCLPRLSCPFCVHYSFCWPRTFWRLWPRCCTRLSHSL